MELLTQMINGLSTGGMYALVAVSYTHLDVYKRQIIAKAKNKQFKVVLEKIGADRVVRPEKEMGERVARSMLRKNITDLVEIDESYSIVEMKVPLAWVGHSLNGLDLRKNYGINILGLRDMKTHKLLLSIDPSYLIQNEDHFLMIAETDKIEKFDYLVEK